jgi:hypothetical protein
VEGGSQTNQDNHYGHCRQPTIGGLLNRIVSEHNYGQKHKEQPDKRGVNDVGIGQPAYVGKRPVYPFSNPTFSQSCPIEKPHVSPRKHQDSK